ncbi:hypothetical protein ACTXN9_02215 [Corynebacterium casei]|uniref:hypothetical protein n=1 Tax=Corynebacterium casei TaxID=160386 RepID=UPI0009C6D068|nr:hypothetical protein [Corynebacterium casei]MDN5707764.1 hypothetical protein [Corynebacterium casei]MDN5729144.1 hypothetical protein [Corynebacterium casei]MDN5740266.1 hypothetical protein [Corynebacterium casei]MDN5798456.1 hypothetical protein [Corynebacterium casei]MDN5826745.1 hypothetical protein [Corynebacterium casei]
MSEHSMSSPRHVNRFLAACLSLSLVTGTAVVTSTSSPAAFAQDAENDDTDAGNNSEVEDEDEDEQPEVSSWDTSSVATDEESDMGRAVNAISFVLAVGGMVGIAASLVMHFAAMALPEVPWKN